MRYIPAFLLLSLAGCAGGFAQSQTAHHGNAVSGYYALPLMFVPMTIAYGSKPEPAASDADAGADPDTKKSGTPEKADAAKKTAADPKTGKKPTPAPPPEKTVTVKMGTPIYVPDPAYRYTVKLAHKFWSTDHIKIDTDASGLLSGVNADSQDQSGTVVNKIVELGAAAAKVAASFSMQFADMEMVGATKELQCDKPKEDFSLDIAFDPTNPRQVAALQKKLCEKGVMFDAWRVGDQSAPIDHAKSDGTTTAQSPPAGQKADDKKSADKKLEDFTAQFEDQTACDGAKICFRPAIPYNIVADTHTYLAVAPDPGMTLGVDFDRVPFQTSTLKLVFSNGMLTSTEDTKPSELVAALQIPIDALNTIAAIPGQLLTIHVNNTTSESSLLTQQDAILQTQAKMIADLQALKDAQAAPHP